MDPPTQYHKCLGKYGYILYKDQMTKEEIAEVKKELTTKTTVLPAYKDFQKPKIYKLFMQSQSMLYIPRFYGLEKFGTPQYTTLTPGVGINCTCLYDPLPHQAKAIEVLERVFDPTKQLGDGGVLSLPCGYGKTYCAIRTICKLGLSGLIIVPTECLMDQWMDAIRTFVPGARVGYVQQNHMDYEDKDFVVAMLHSICLKDYPIQMFDRFGIVVYDECHHVASEVFSKSMLKVRPKFTLGLSATPERRDGLSHVFYKFIGPLLHKEKRTGTNTVIIKKFLLHSTSEHYEKLRMSNGTINTAGMTTAISKYDERNQLIIYTIKSLIQQGRKILLLSSRKEHLHNIKDMLDRASIKHPESGRYITYGFYYGKKGMTRQAHKKLLSESAKCDVVLGIDVIAREGLDIPDLNTLIMATPAGVDVEQPVGRILRKFHKELNPLVIDLVDNTGNYVKHSKERDKWYDSESYIIQERELELLGQPELWEHYVTDYLQRKKVQVIKKRSMAQEEQIPQGPDMDQLMLDTPMPDPEPKPRPTPHQAKLTIKRTTRAHKKVPKQEGPDMNLCMLADHGGLKKPPTRKKVPSGPDMNELML